MEQNYSVRECRKFPVVGQGTFLYTTGKAESFSLLVTEEPCKNPCGTTGQQQLDEEDYELPKSYIALHVDKKKAQFAIKYQGKNKEEVLK